MSFINSSMLQVSCAYGRLNNVAFLLESGVDINYREGVSLVFLMEFFYYTSLRPSFCSSRKAQSNC